MPADVVRCRARGDMAFPADDERQADAALVNVLLIAVQSSVGLEIERIGAAKRKYRRCPM